MRNPMAAALSLTLAAACAGGPRAPEAESAPGSEAVAAPPAEATAPEEGRAGWEHRRGDGFAFRAVGEEPGWLAEVAPGRTIRVLLDYGEREVEVPATEPVREGNRVVFASRTPEHTLRLVVEESPCSDTMSGEAFSHTVLLVVDGRELTGCGRPLSGAGAGIDGSWRLVELEGTPALRSGEGAPHLSISGGRVAGSGGCNAFGGYFFREDDQVGFVEIEATLRACPDERLTRQEARFLAALGEVDRIDLAGDDLRLHAGNRLLARLERMDPR
jgi:heat shock protein HslJ/uncharacterized membrane protein